MPRVQLTSSAGAVKAEIGSTTIKALRDENPDFVVAIAKHESARAGSRIIEAVVGVGTTRGTDHVGGHS